MQKRLSGNEGMTAGSAKLTPMRGIPWKLLAAGGLSALLLDLPFPLAGPLPAWRTVFAWFALVPLLVEILRFPEAQAGRSRRHILVWSFLAGWFSGALWFGSNCYWVYGTMNIYAGMSVPLAAFSLLLFSLFLGFWFGIFALALALIRMATLGPKISWLALAAVPFLWVAMEFAIARIPSFPWDQLGYSQVDNGLLTPLAPLTGVSGISFLLAAVNALLAAALILKPTARRFSPRVACGVAGVTIAAIGMAGLLLKTPQPPGGTMAMLIQPNLDVASDDVWVGPDWDRHIRAYQQLAVDPCRTYIAGIPQTGAPSAVFNCGMSALKPSLVVTPESPAPFHDADPRFRTTMTAFAGNARVPMIVGDLGMDLVAPGNEYRIYNSATVIAGDGQFAGRYDKIHLVPFGEYIPFRHLLFFARQVTQTLSDMSRGSDRKVFTVGGRRYGIFICYESVFADEVRQFAQNGAEVFVNISDDGWYGDTSAPWQHLNMARMRAIENRRWILRDTNNGVTASIDPYGAVRQSIPRHRVDVLPAEYGYSTELTFYTRHGDVFAAVCAILSLALLVWSVRVILWQQPRP